MIERHANKPQPPSAESFLKDGVHLGQIYCVLRKWAAALFVRGTTPMIGGRAGPSHVTLGDMVQHGRMGKSGSQWSADRCIRQVAGLDL